MSTLIRSTVSALMITTIAMSTFLVSTPPAHAETVSQCRARAYRLYDRLIESGYTEAEAQKELHQSLARCEQG